MARVTRICVCVCQDCQVEFIVLHANKNVKRCPECARGARQKLMAALAKARSAKAKARAKARPHGKCVICGAPTPSEARKCCSNPECLKKRRSLVSKEHCYKVSRRDKEKMKPVKCLRCDKIFVPISKFNRICPTCTQINNDMRFVGAW